MARLAKEAGVGLSTVQEIEKFNGEPRVVQTLQCEVMREDEAVCQN